MSDQHLVLTGGLGFIGSHVADAYLAAGWKVTIIDSEVSSVVDGTCYERHPLGAVLRTSVEQFLAEGGSFKGATRVIHAASMVGPVRLLPHAGQLGAR